MSGTWLM